MTLPGALRAWFRVALALAVVLSGTAGCRRRDALFREIRVSVLPYLSYAPLFLAEEAGDFRRENVAVRFVPFRRNADASVALLAGRLDATTGILTPADLNAVLRGARVRVVADKGHEERGRCPFGGFVVRRGFGSPQGPTAGELAGARFALFHFSSSEFLMDRLLDSLGVAPEKVRVTELPVPNFIPALESGAVDVIQADEPDLTRLLDSGRARIWKTHTDILPRYQLAYVLFGSSLLGPDRAAGVAFLKGYLRGVRRYRQGKTLHNIEVMESRTGLPRALLERACWPDIEPDGRIDPSTLVLFQEWLQQKGAIPRALPVDQVWDPAPAREASRQLAAETGR